MPGTLVTFGYHGLRTPQELAQKLGNGVATTVIDVRMSRASRIPAFSFRTQTTVENAGYQYAWLSGLGNAEYRTGGMRLLDPSQIDVLVERLAAGENVAIMCVCSDVATCHRRMVADLTHEALPDLVVVDL